MIQFARLKKGEPEPLSDEDFEDMLQAVRDMNLPDVDI